jgi:hypothetical protein
MWILGRDSSRSYLGRSVSVPVSKHLRLKGGTTKVTWLVLTEVSRGRSTDLPRPTETERTERVVAKEYSLYLRPSKTAACFLESQLRSIGFGGHRVPNLEQHTLNPRNVPRVTPNASRDALPKSIG